MVLKGVNRVHNDKIKWNSVDRSKLGTQRKDQVIWSWKESFGYNGLESSQLGRQ